MDYQHLYDSVILKGRGLPFLVPTYSKVFKYTLATCITPGSSNKFIMATQHQNCSLWEEVEIMESNWKCLVLQFTASSSVLPGAVSTTEWTSLWTQRQHSLWIHGTYWYLLSNVHKYICVRKTWDEKVALWFCPSIILLN